MIKHEVITLGKYDLVDDTTLRGVFFYVFSRVISFLFKLRRSIILRIIS